MADSPTWTRVVGIYFDLVGSSAEMERVGNKAGDAAFDTQISAFEQALRVVDPSIHRGEDQGDGTLFTADRERVVKLFKAAAQFLGGQERWSEGLLARVAIGEGDAVVRLADPLSGRTAGVRGRALNRTAKLLKNACRPGEIIITETIYEAIADAGEGHRLHLETVDLKDLGRTRYWVLRARGDSEVAERDEEERDEQRREIYSRAQRMLEVMELRLKRMEENQTRGDLATAEHAKNLAAMSEIVKQLSWKFAPVRVTVIIMVSLAILGLVATVGILWYRAASAKALYGNGAPMSRMVVPEAPHA